MRSMFLELKPECSVVEKLTELASRVTYEEHLYTVRGLGGEELLAIVNEDPTLAAIREKYRANPIFLKSHPYILHNWHKDRNRYCAVNLLICGRGHTLFHNLWNEAPLLEVTELKYEPRRMYLINTQQFHTVINNYPEERIVFSLGIHSNGCPFEEVVEWCEEQGIA